MEEGMRNMETTFKQTAMTALAAFALFYGAASAIRPYTLPIPPVSTGQLAKE